eukprot:m.17626 g.17626  ORF g.17626 m.17626 type:complete len:125 (+) comp11592_c1_seq1:62-436(+)
MDKYSSMGYGDSGASGGYGSSPAGGYGGGAAAGGGGAPGMTAADIENAKRELEQMQQQNQFEQIVEKASTTCFKRCVPKPDSSLGSYEKKCMVNCTDRYVESFQLIYSTLMSASMQQTPVQQDF